MQRRSFMAILGTVASGSVLSTPSIAQTVDEIEFKARSSIRVVAWNVACGQWATPARFAAGLAAQQPDLVLTNETPKYNPGIAAADWSKEISNLLQLPYFYVGSISSANHSAPDWGDVSGKYGGKYKSILSRWPISNTHDFPIAGKGWSPASAIRVEVSIEGNAWAIYSLHIPGHRRWEPSKHRALAEDVLANEPLKNVIVGGDFNVATDSAVMAEFSQATGLQNAISQKSIDHILYKSTHPIKISESAIEAGPVGKGPRGGLSDHPYAWAELDVKRDGQLK